MEEAQRHSMIAPATALEQRSAAGLSPAAALQSYCLVFVLDLNNKNVAANAGKDKWVRRK